ncbi:MAG: hypothetical protein H6R26_2702 [Proteobacteria bacterium]|nr:hypothetical protein [Pseudomonadota bacterium]
MRRKPVPNQETIVPKEILERARLATQTDRLELPVKCVVCGSPTAPKSDEDLCWVCRRLKISAWRENDQQIPAQE